MTESGEESTKTYTATFTNPHGFSTFTISTESQTVATLNGDSYTSLQDALADAEDGDTVKVLKNGLTASMSGSSRTITLENGVAECRDHRYHQRRGAVHRDGAGRKHIPTPAPPAVAAPARRPIQSVSPWM